MKRPNTIFREYVSSQTFSPVYTEQFCFSPGVHIPEHNHEFLEIGITTEGSAVHTAYGATVRLSPGSVYFVPPGAVHTVESISTWKICNLYLLPSLFAARFSEPDMHSGYDLPYFLMKLYSNTFLISNFSLPEDSFRTVCSLFDSLEYYPYKKTSSFHIFRENCILNILLLLSQQFRHQPGSDSLSFDPRLPEINRYILNHLDLPLHEIIRGLSDTLFLNPQYISRIIKKHIGIPAGKYINQCKIEKSIQLLRSGIRTTEVSCMLGFYDVSHFHKYFVKYTGLSPAEYMLQFSSSSEEKPPGRD